MPPARIYLVRHGTSEWNLLKKWQGTVNTNLAPEGVAQASARAKVFHQDGVQFDTCSTSDLNRASRTAELLMKTCGGSTSEVIPDSRLRECTLGKFEGMTKSDIYGPKYAGLWAYLAGLPHEVRIRTPYFDGLETPLDVGTRAASCLVDTALDAPSNGTCLCVTHSTVIESLLASLFGADFESVDTANLAWVRFRLEPRGRDLGGWRLVLEDTESVSFRHSPDAVVCDPEACRRLRLAPGLVPFSEGGGPQGQHPQQRRWLLVTMASALALALAGVAELVLNEGEIGAKGASTTTAGAAGAGGVASGHWGVPTASVDWCEANYAVSPFVAEFGNTLSSALLTAAGLWAAKQARHGGAEVRYAALGFVLALVGVGSAAYHATLRKQEQALDEVPMLWLAVLANYCVLQGDRAPTSAHARATAELAQADHRPTTVSRHATTAAKAAHARHSTGARTDASFLAPSSSSSSSSSTPSPSSSTPASSSFSSSLTTATLSCHGGWLQGTEAPRGAALAWGLALYALALSVLQWRSSGALQPLAFHASFGTAELGFLRGAWLQYRRGAFDPRLAATFERAFALYALAVGSWALDNAFCGPLQWATSVLTGGLCPYPQLHALGWHGLIALASALLIVACTAERLVVLSTVCNPSELEASWPSSPPSSPPLHLRHGSRVWLRPSKYFGFFSPYLYRADSATSGDTSSGNSLAQK